MATTLKVSSILFGGDNTTISSKYFIVPKSTKMIFNENSAPTGWTQDTTTNDSMLRVVNSSGGSTVTTNRVTFGNIFKSQPFTVSSGAQISGVEIGATTLSSNQIPQHQHSYYGAGCSSYKIFRGGFPAGLPLATCGNVTGPTGSTNSHSHPVSTNTFSASSNFTVDFTVKYISCIMCTLS